MFYMVNLCYKNKLFNTISLHAVGNNKAVMPLMVFLHSVGLIQAHLKQLLLYINVCNLRIYKRCVHTLCTTSMTFILFMFVHLSNANTLFTFWYYLHVKCREESTFTKMHNAALYMHNY